jgi:hypothetical protein
MAKLATHDARMLILMRHCIDTEICDSQKDFLASIKFSETNLRKVRLGETSFTIEHFLNAARKYKINMNWFAGASEEMKLQPGKTALQQLKEAVRAVEAAAIR